MPELPEVETLRRDLDAAFTGLRITGVEVDGVRTLRRHTDPAAIPARLTGQALQAVQRRGKYLIFQLDGGDAMVVHLGMSGQLLVVEPDLPAAPHTHLVVSWARGPQLRFVDPRTFGQVFVAEFDHSGVVPELAHLGFDPLEDRIGWQDFGRRLAARRTKIKPLLMDQRFVAGIGNLYCDEMLWSARILHDRPADELAPDEVKTLYRAMLKTLRDAVSKRGSSLADAQYRDLTGRVGQYQAHHHVYGREGMPCDRCGTPISRVKSYGRSSWYCPSCQR